MAMVSVNGSPSLQIQNEKNIYFTAITFKGTCLTVSLNCHIIINYQVLKFIQFSIVSLMQFVEHYQQTVSVFEKEAIKIKSMLYLQTIKNGISKFCYIVFIIMIYQVV